MSESGPEGLPPGQEATGAATSTSMTAGRLLAAQREQMGVHLAALAATLKVPLHKLKALEADQYDQFPDVVFLRALASSVCRTLKMDAAPVLALLPHSAPVALKDQQGLNARFKEPGVRADGAAVLGLPMSRVAALTVIVLLAAALVIAFLPRAGSDASDTAELAVQVQPLPQAQEAEPVAAEPPAELATPAASEPAASPAPALVAPPPDATTESAPETASVTPQTLAPTPAAAEPLVIQAREESWVQVRDAGGAVLVERNLQKGERYVTQGGGPWSVIVGRADAVDVTVRGEPMDLSAIARSNVARFEVK